MVPGGSRVWLVIQMSPGMDSWDPKSSSKHPNIQPSLIRSPPKTTYYLWYPFFFFRSVVSLQYWNLPKIAVPNGRSRKLGLRDERSSFAQRLAEATPFRRFVWLTSPGFGRGFPYQKTVRFVGETGMFCGRFLVGLHPFFSSWIFSVLPKIIGFKKLRMPRYLSHKRFYPPTSC